MTIQDLLEEAYEDTNTSTANYPYTKGLKKLNEIYSEMYRMIVTTQEDYFWTYWTTNLQEGAREYKVEREWTTLLDENENPVLDDQGNEIKVPGIEKVKKVIIRTDEEDAIFPGHSDLKQFHKVLMDGVRAELWEHKQDFEKSDRAKARYEEGLEKMKRYISQRVQSIYYSDVQN